MATQPIYVNGHSEPLHWSEFCEEQAAVAASEFYTNFNCYLRDNPSLSVVDTASRFLQRFIDCLQSDFYQCIERGQPIIPDSRGGYPPGEYFSQDRSSPSSSNDVDSQKQSKSKSFLRRLSFRKKLRSKDGRESSADEEQQHKTKSKQRTNIKKEGIVFRLVENTSSGSHKWEKCRLALVNNSSGYLLEFYSPPKNAKPKAGLYCSMLNKCRETTALEMPDREHTFVLKASNNTHDYVFEANNASDLRSWLGHIRQCMPEENNSSRPHSESGGHFIDNHQMDIPSSYPNPNEQYGYSERTVPPPVIPPRSPARASYPSISQGPVPAPIHPPDNGVVQPLDLTSLENIELYLREFPWFHGTFSRMDAAHLVLHQGQAGHGFFLVRQSETRKGEFVLTFNFQGRAKHLRMTINNEGQCRVQHLWFQTIFDMLEHFRTHPIPLESGGSSDVTLTDYVVASATGLEGISASQGGSVRMTTASLERLSTAPRASQHAPAYV
ncbi:SH2B adapter protein 2-like [Watersipora subatra]|uniref:SH2B adapter protein 2-like n=1 Tax=Watersipora subatra TaxID=2589382 RepID=UPI00355B33B0